MRRECRDLESESMRWESKLQYIGDIRVRSGFLWFPKSILVGQHGKQRVETRWLEQAKWREELVCGKGRDFWCPINWADDLL